MEAAEANRGLIVEHETWFAGALSRRVVKAPKLSLWMILIPIIFVFYFFQLNKVKNGRVEFVEDYLKSRLRSLNAAAKEVATGEKPDHVALAGLSDVPAEVRPHQARFSEALAGHYAGLLRASGEDFAALVRAAYREKTNLLLFYNRLNQAEHAVNSVLMPHLEEAIGGVAEVVRAMEAESAALRREVADEVFK